MGLTREEAYEILELPVGVDQDSIRLSYKRLALKWHPDKHPGSQDAQKKFKLISKSYRRLITGETKDDMSLNEMLALFKEVFMTKQVNSYNGSGYDSSDDDDDEDDDDIEEEVKCSNLFPDKIKLKQDWKKAREDNDSNMKMVSPEEARKNAEELITEEEKEKRRAEKRRAKKKRRREKKKMEKVTGPETTKEEKKSSKQKNKDTLDGLSERSKKADNRADVSTSSDEAGFDPNAAFFTKVVNKKKKNPLVEAQPSKARSRGDKSDEETEDLDPKTLRSRQLAIKGNEMAHLGHYPAAIELFSEAIKLDPKDFRFFGNRSYCYDRIQQYEKALKDAEKAISLQKDWPKGYFRKGRALAGLKMSSEAEQAFTQVLKLDKNCDDAVQELLRVRTQQIMEMGFTRQQAEAAIKTHGTVQEALDSLLAGVAENSLSGEVYVSDDEESFTPASPQHLNSIAQNPQDSKMDPKNPEGLTALWVGNVLPEVTDKKLQQMFSKFGQVKSVRCLPDKYCAFVNFTTKEAAGKAMVGLQGIECQGQRLLIKFPDHPITNGNSHGTITIRKNQYNKSNGTINIGSAVHGNPKASGPVNGNECYFWRTTGCSYGDKCRNAHIPANKGVDKKPWQKDS